MSLLRKLWNKLPTVDQLAEVIGRDRSCVNKYAKRLGLPHHQRRDQWLPEREEQLRVMWEGGTPRAEICRILHVTPGMVCGKARRMGLTRPPRMKRERKERQPKEVRFRAPSRKAAQRRFKASLSPVIPQGIQIPEKPETGSCPPSKPAQSILGPEPLNVPLLDTGYRKCKFIRGQDDKCCGHPVRWVGQPYCDYHYRITHISR